MTDIIEFYDDDTDSLIVSVKSSMVPKQGRTLNIKKISYRVVDYGYCIDHSDCINRKCLRAYVYLKKLGDKP